ncbi:thioesterase II family protein [Streptosporangium sp. NBC_01756]|uniref:thioesterase II family protein n=1 Tax=Streptosporangium sp. NBC_01756 TaxID=2975950 RepID=UPI002DDC0ED6|nr:alpha/beta fold hydrolase [Streptosporangium sp. NBC_01756]WSC85976.1 alpha/beta fold hydrolase [Streptosporangium sp. NBC_01756]
MTWLRSLQPRPEAAAVLLCFPHAAGSASFFRPWARELTGFDVHAVQYPGRADRFADDLPTDLVAMAKGLRESLEPLTDRPIVLFGHSMGAIVAYEVARLLETTGVDVPHLVVSGARAAHDPEFAPVGAAQRSDESIMRSLAKLGGTEAELFSDPLLAELAMPYVRADFVMFENYRHVPGDPLRCPTTTVNGTGDGHCSPDRARRWAELTSGAFDALTLPGEHFYLIGHPPYELLRSLG